ncbi:hypothetical protein [Clostridium sp. UBA4548]|uniref:hypothetical protein n=1 Tax=Clostridium sp. UBA4548 TaxID=1946361 RepID=UPI0025C6B15F|nr:hypothetical protein [Clostridium sp. UBA4548]
MVNINKLDSNYFQQQINYNTNNNIVNNMEANVKRDNWLEEICDVIDFSFDYSNDEIMTIVGDISSKFNREFTIYGENNEISMAEHVNGYGKILNSIKNNLKLSVSEKEQLTKVLDTSFDSYTKTMAKEFADRIDLFFNNAYYQKVSNMQDHRDLGIKAEKLADSEKVEANISKMISATKVFYKNNLEGTDKELQHFLKDSFCKTDVMETIENLSYKDFISLQDTLKMYYSNLAQAFGEEDKVKNADNAISKLELDGSSKELITKFEEAMLQNRDSNTRIHFYEVINTKFNTSSDKLKDEVNEYVKFFKDLEKQKMEMDKKHQKELEDFERKLEEQMLKIIMINAKSPADQREALMKLQRCKVRFLDELELKIRAMCEESKERLEKLAKDKKDFHENPSKLINEYLETDKIKNKEILHNDYKLKYKE